MVIKDYHQTDFELMVDLVRSMRSEGNDDEDILKYLKHEGFLEKEVVNAMEYADGIRDMELDDTIIKIYDDGVGKYGHKPGKYLGVM